MVVHVTVYNAIEKLFMVVLPALWNVSHLLRQQLPAGSMGTSSKKLGIERGKSRELQGLNSWPVDYWIRGDTSALVSEMLLKRSDISKPHSAEVFVCRGLDRS